MKIIKIHYKNTSTEYTEDSCDSVLVSKIENFVSMNLSSMHDSLTNEFLGYNLLLRIENYAFSFLCILKVGDKPRDVAKIYNDILLFLSDNRKFIEIRSNGYSTA